MWSQRILVWLIIYPIISSSLQKGSQECWATSDSPDIIRTVCFYTGISEVPDISFNKSVHNVTEAEGNLTVCAVAGQLAEEVLPVRVTISTASGTAKSKLYITLTVEAS